MEEDEVYERLRGDWEVRVEGKAKRGVRRVIKVEEGGRGGESERKESPLRSIKAEPGLEEAEVKIKAEPKEEEETITSNPLSEDQKLPSKTSRKSERKTRSQTSAVKEEQEDRVKSEPPED